MPINPNSTFVGGTNGNDDISRDLSNSEGSYLYARGGDDILRGGKYDDVLVGGEGSDLMFGGLGADSFRFYGNEISGASDTDKIFDLNFAEGDDLVFGGFTAGTFADAEGINAYSLDGSATITSWTGLAHAVVDSGLVSASLKNGTSGATGVLILDIEVGGAHQLIHISGGWEPLQAAIAAL